MSFDKNRKSVQFLPSWPNSHAPKAAPAESTITPSVHEESLDQVTLNELQQGELYILKIKLIVIALFEGWDDDMCCFSILRTDLLEELRWSEARYLPNNFDAYLAFDYAGNPPIHLWTKQLRAVIPINWFNIFEEARHMQRQWHVSFWNPEPQAVMLIDNNPHQDSTVNVQDEQIQDTEQFHHHHHYDESTSIALHDDDNNNNNTAPQPSKTNPTQSELPTKLDSSLAQPTVTKSTTPAMRLQNQYIRSTSDVVQRSTIEDIKPTKPETKPSKSENTQRTIPPARPEVKQRRSFSSFFMKKKSKKQTPDKATKRKSVPTTTATTTPKLPPSVLHQKPSIIDIPARRTSEQIEVITSHSSTSDKAPSSLSSPIIKTPKNDAMDGGNTNKVELFDMESYFDMQATFAFLNNTTTEGFSLMDLSSATAKTKA